MAIQNWIAADDRAKVLAALEKLHTPAEGLPTSQAQALLESHGPNQIGQNRQTSALHQLLQNFLNPLVLLLFSLALISHFTGDHTGALVMWGMVLLGVILKFIQERRADQSAQALQAMVEVTASVIRDNQMHEIPLHEIVPGDLLHLSSGDMIPADLHLVSAKDLFVNESALTGESLPVEKNAEADFQGPALENPAYCFMGSNVESGSALGVVRLTGSDTYFGKLADRLSQSASSTSFDKGVERFTWLMIRFIFILAPAVFVINGLTKGDWMQAFLFSVAVAVGLTPEMLPMIVTVNLSKGALAMSDKKVIVKKLSAIQNFGAMDVLCTDKTGTLTSGKVALEHYVNLYSQDSPRVLKYGYINSFYQTGLKNLIDVAILEHAQEQEAFRIAEKYEKIDEIPFDFLRKRMSVVVRNKRCEDVLICKGAVEEILARCSHYETKDSTEPFSPWMQEEIDSLVQEFHDQGYRVIAIAYKVHLKSKTSYTVEDENDLVLLGFMAFLDPPKASTREALEKFKHYQVDVKILTGDNEAVSRNICRQVGLEVKDSLTGKDIEALDDQALRQKAPGVTLFSKLSPLDKERIIGALQDCGHVVGFLGDGINDAPALKAADVGISVHSAVDIAKESSDIILLENSLLVLEEGVLEGRRVFGNIVKYIKMTASSNFGNMFSVLGASLLLPFLPMLPIQVLANNLLYDLSQTAIPTDTVDEEWIARPRSWDIEEIKRYIFRIGPISSLFDYVTFAVLWFGFKAYQDPVLFQTGWFIESLLTQTLIIHVIRTDKVPFIESTASRTLLIATGLTMAFGVFLIHSPLAALLFFKPLPGLYYPVVGVILLCYLLLTQWVKNRYFRSQR